MALLNGAARVNILSTWKNGQAISNTWHIFNSGAGSPPDFAELTQLAADVVANFESPYRAMMQSDDFLEQVSVAQVPDPTDPEPVAEAVNVLHAAGTSTGGNEDAPSQICGVMKITTAGAGRRFRGRLFLGPPRDKNDLNGQKFGTSSGYKTNVDALMAVYRTGLQADISWTGDSLPDYFLVVYSKAAQVAGDPSMTPAIAITCDYTVHWLRRRGRGTS